MGASASAAGGGSGRPSSSGNRMLPPMGRRKLLHSNYHLYWSLQPDHPDRYYKKERFNKFRTLPEVTKPVWAFDLAEYTMVLAAAMGDSAVYLWDLLMDPPELKVSLRNHKAHVWAVCFSPNEAALATGGSDKTVRIWVAETGMLLQVLEGHTEGIRCLAFSLDGFLLSGGMDAQICLWEYEVEVPTATWKAHEGHVHSLSFTTNRQSVNKNLALSVGSDGAVAGWRVESRGVYEPMGRFAGGGGGGVLCVQLHTTEENWCACGNEDGAVWVWNFRAAGEPGSEQMDVEGHLKLVGHKQGVRTLAFTPDGCLLASGSTDGYVRVWDVRKMHEQEHEVCCVAVFLAHDSWVTELRFEGGARGLVTASSDGLVKHWVAPPRLKRLVRLRGVRAAVPEDRALVVADPPTSQRSVDLLTYAKTAPPPVEGGGAQPLHQVRTLFHKGRTAMLSMLDNASDGLDSDYGDTESEEEEGEDEAEHEGGPGAEAEGAEGGLERRPPALQPLAPPGQVPARRPLQPPTPSSLGPGGLPTPPATPSVGAMPALPVLGYAGQPQGRADPWASGSALQAHAQARIVTAARRREPPRKLVESGLLGPGSGGQSLSSTLE